MAKPGRKKGSIPWNYGLTKETDDRVRKSAESKRGRKQTKDHKERNSKSHMGKEPWNKGLTKETDKRMRKNVESNTGKIQTPEHIENARKARGEIWNKGKKTGTLTPEHIRKLRLAAIKRIEENIKNGGQIFPNHNPEGCKLIEEYGKLYRYNFQHAENGGEFHIKELGYWVDGYDKEKNVVMEIDESVHFSSGGNLSKKDIERQEEIEDFLKCKFIRLRI